MTYEEIVQETKDLVSKHSFDGIEGHLAVEVDIVGEGEGAFYIEIKDGAAYVEPYEYYDNDCKLIVSGEDFLKICNGKLDPVKAFTVGKLKIKGDIEKALEFSKIIESVKKKKTK